MLIRRAGGSLLDLQNREVLEGKLVFTTTKRWWGKLFRDYSHVHAIVRRGRHWVLFLPGMDITHLEVLENWRLAVPDGAKVLHFRVNRRTNRVRSWHLFHPFTCVEQIKALLGIANPLIVTPRQLFRRMADESVWR